MNINTRYLRNVVVPASYIGVRRGIFWATLAFALSGCAALRESGTENPPVPSVVETKLQPGPTPPNRVNASIAPLAAGTTLADGKTATPQPAPIAATGAEPAREIARTFVGTGNFQQNSQVVLWRGACDSEIHSRITHLE